MEILEVSLPFLALIGVVLAVGFVAGYDIGYKRCLDNTNKCLMTPIKTPRQPKDWPSGRRHNNPPPMTHGDRQPLRDTLPRTIGHSSDEKLYERDEDGGWVEKDDRGGRYTGARPTPPTRPSRGNTPCEVCSLGACKHKLNMLYHAEHGGYYTCKQFDAYYQEDDDPNRNNAVDDKGDNNVD